MASLLAEVGCAPRVQALVRDLGIEKSTASRVARGVRAADGESALREFPAVDGIAKVVAACEGRASAVRIAEARRAIDGLRASFAEFPGGRAVAIEALGGRSGATAGATDGARRGTDMRSRVRAERAAARAIFSGNRFFHGASAAHQYSLRVQIPTASGDLFEPAGISVISGLARLRRGAPIAVHASRVQKGTSEPLGLLTLEGEPVLILPSTETIASTPASASETSTPAFE
jgi:hypothetical protein